ncbi:hypothetical protein L873DRAFT_1675551 [Choiromyces venosus 120613-1]|uniref:Uncharacterized protein n=1 Tax=Choiromyces venosus 120613-1 TaxID=1336337 RepID=A0A3N4JZJ8_9PEZI|nr:hypothetical protein L873DRAFT_1675551 [Choiromyces venosus 120613-1]
MTQNSAQGGSYASTGHSNYGKKSSDTAWLVGSIAVTVPSALYLLYSSPAKKPAHHGSNHHASSSTPEEEGASSDEETAKSQMDSASESVSEATEDARDQAKEKSGEMGEKAGELYGRAKDKVETSIMGVTDKAASVKGKAGETLEHMTEEFKNRAHGDDKDSKEGAGKPNQGGGKKGPDDSQGREGADIPKEPVSERKKVEQAGGDSKASETLSDLKKKQNPSKKPSQIDPPAAGMKGQASTSEMSGKQEGLSSGDTWHAVRIYS